MINATVRTPAVLLLLASLVAKISDRESHS